MYKFSDKNSNFALQLLMIMKVTEIENAHKLFRKGMATVAYSDENIVVMDGVHYFGMYDDDVDINGFVLISVKTGSCVLSVNGVPYDLNADDLFICGPRNTISQVEASEDFEVYGFLLSPEYILYILKQTNLDVASYLMSATCSKVQITKEECGLFRTYHALLGSRLRHTDSPLQRKLVDNLLQAAAVEMAILFAKYGLPDVMPSSFTSAEQIFQKFVELLRKHDKHMRSVNDYAKLLEVTPKYFSTVCKQISGKTASEIINDETVAEAKVLLQNPANSIKFVAEKLGFTNQSHFGTFMRRHTGLSPQQLRVGSKN